MKLKVFSFPISSVILSSNLKLNHTCMKKVGHTYRAKHTEIGNFSSFFALLPPPKKPQNQNLEK